MSDLFALTSLPCPVCKARYHHGATIRIAARLCLACGKCQYHCLCGPAQRLEELEPIAGLLPDVDEPVVIYPR
jgi:hypothetical protein